MQEWFYYLVKMWIVSGVLFTYYWVVLRDEQFHHWNRFYLLFTLLASIGLPFVSVSIQSESLPLDVTAPVTEWSTWFNRQQSSANSTDWHWAVALWLAISIVLLIRLCSSLIQLWLKHRNQEKHVLGSFLLIFTTDKAAPYSFFHWLFWRKDIDLQSSHAQRMLQHEMAHATEGHTYDKLLVEVLMTLVWLNPFYWCIRKELYLIHEYLADKKAIPTADGAAFAAMILHAIPGQQPSGYVHGFLSSTIKRRLTMIMNTQTTSYSYLRRLSSLLLLVVVSTAVTLQVQKAVAQTLTPTVPKVESVSTPPPPPPPLAPALYIVDGQKVTKATIEALAPDQIATINVLKGKSAIEKYGNSAADGVIEIITTAAAGKLAPPPPPPPPPRKRETMSELSINANGDGNPMYIIDGKPASKEEVQKLNPNIIASIHILKGPETKKWGDKAKDGVIEITTKKVI